MKSKIKGIIQLLVGPINSQKLFIHNIHF